MMQVGAGARGIFLFFWGLPVSLTGLRAAVSCAVRVRTGNVGCVTPVTLGTRQRFDRRGGVVVHIVWSGGVRRYICQTDAPNRQIGRFYGQDILRFPDDRNAKWFPNHG